jgi:hypothetical protein
MANKTEHFCAGHISDFNCKVCCSEVVLKIKVVWDVIEYGPVIFVVQTETWNSVAIWLLCVSE